jgi:hypothetical protein
MLEEPEPSQELLVARRALEGLKGCTLLHDWEWNPSMRRWTLACRLTRSGKINQLVPVETEWYFLVETTYPWGTIKCYPSKQAGLSQTFPHQCYNGSARPDIPWRDGDICLATSVHVLGRHGFDVEPYEPHRRLRWYVQRAHDWLTAAAEGNLAQIGDPFELPHFPNLSSALTTVAFSEGANSFARWQEINECCGTLDLLCLRGKPELLLVKRFRSHQKQILVEASWGKLLEETYGKTLKSGIWIRLPGTPIITPWQAPTTWEELRSACQEQGVAIDELLKKTLASVRDGKEHIAMLGFPIPEHIGGKLSHMHWQALQLPTLSAGTKTAKGFRTNEAGYWQRDRMEIFKGSAKIDWHLSENWHPEQLGTRGTLPAQIASANILLLGAGALGATLAEQLVRAGMRRLTIVDEDRLEAGNLVRHPLGIFDLKENKATRLAIHLSLASPHASITAIPASFPNLSSSELALAQQCNVVLDCTGQDDVLRHLEAFSWQETKLFVSLSLGFRARRLFCFAASGSCFPHADFQKCLHPWLEQEIQEYADERFPREGVGCWHPVFPARIDDITMMVSAAIKHLESTMIAPLSSSLLTIFEQQYAHGHFLGIRKIAPEENDG